MRSASSSRLGGQAPAGARGHRNLQARGCGVVPRISKTAGCELCVPATNRLTICQASTSEERSISGWQKAREAFLAGEVFTGVISGMNNGGVTLDCFGVQGFIPNRMMPAERLEVGQEVRALFVEVDQASNRMILSPRQLQVSEQMSKLTVGEVIEGEVTSLQAYGAFIDVTLPDGTKVSGLVHKSELSWGAVTSPEDIVSVGDTVKCKVLSVALGRLSLSMKQTKPDPLKQNLASFLKSPESGSTAVDWVDADAPLPGLEDTVFRLQASPGVIQVTYGRQAFTEGHLSQDLELWLGNEASDGVFDLVARAGSTIQEMQIIGTLGKQELKELIDEVMSQEPVPKEV